MKRFLISLVLVICLLETQSWEMVARRSLILWRVCINGYEYVAGTFDNDGFSIVQARTEYLGVSELKSCVCSDTPQPEKSTFMDWLKK